MSYARNGDGITEYEKAVIKDCFTIRPPSKLKGIGIDGTEEFLWQVKNFPKKKCCSTCSRCARSAIRNSRPVMRAYCLYWKRFLYMMKANPYKDYCAQWEFSDRKPLVFYKKDSPVNVDIDGNTVNEVMGYPLERFGRKKSKDVRLVTDIGLDISSVPDI